MSSYNTLQASIECPRCRDTSLMEIQLFCGNTWLGQTYRLGDVYSFAQGKAPRNGGPPEDPASAGPCYAECPHCGRDFFCRVAVEHVVTETAKGRLLSVDVDWEMLPYDTDLQLPTHRPCPTCGSCTGQIQQCEGYGVARYVCLEKGCRHIETIRADEMGRRESGEQ